MSGAWGAHDFGVWVRIIILGTHKNGVWRGRSQAEGCIFAVLVLKMEGSIWIGSSVKVYGNVREISCVHLESTSPSFITILVNSCELVSLITYPCFIISWILLSYESTSLYQSEYFVLTVQ